MRAAHFGGLLIAALAVSSGIGVGAWARPLANSEEEANADRLYRNGILPSGLPLVGKREGGVKVLGAAGACINCHRRSGLGTFEGRTVVPPITGPTRMPLWPGRSGKASARTGAASIF